MGRIAAFVEIENPTNPGKRIECDALVDTGASHMVLPAAWRKRLGEMKELGKVDMLGHRLIHIKRLDLK